MAQAVVAKIGPTAGIVRPETLQAIIDGVLPLSRSRCDCTADNGCTDAEANRRADVAATATPTAAPASTTSATTLRVGWGNT